MNASHRNVHNLIILDESGSMQDIKGPTIAGFNELVQSIRGSQDKFPEQRHYITLVSFNGTGIRHLITRQPVASLQPLDEKRYQPDSMTPLFDAIGESCRELEKAIQGREDTWCLVHILTDGLENASREYSGKAVSDMIGRLGQGNWTFTYIGANHDVHGVADFLRIDNAMPFVSSREGSEKMWNRFRHSSEAFARKMSDRDFGPESLKKGFFFDETEDKDRT
jgi:hypothetical protein